MSFLGKLADQLSSQFSAGENDTHNLDAVVDGQNTKYGKLGDFAGKFDQSAERNYVEEGYLRQDPFNVDTKQREVLMQEPNATILVKKRMFSSLADNYRPDHMDADEKLFLKSSKILFANKCKQIAALEKLSKIAKVVEGAGNVGDEFVSLIISLADEVGVGFNNLTDGLTGSSQPSDEVTQFYKTVDSIRKVYAFSKSANYTTWITDKTNIFKSTYADGTGVIELTNVTSLRTSISVNSMGNPGKASFSISDPYESMTITEYDIEQAISDATNSFYNHKILQLGQTSSDDIISGAIARLNQLRRARKVSPITFRINPDTLLGKRVTAIIDRLGEEIPFTFDFALGLSALKANNGVDVPAEYLYGGSIAGLDGLSDNKQKTLLADQFGESNFNKAFPDSELSNFQKAVSAIFTKMSLEKNSKQDFKSNNEKTNYVRRKMRFDFLGKQIIQPMDQLHIYIGSKSLFDNKILSGLKTNFSGLSIIQKIANTGADIKDQFNALFNPGANLDFNAEKAVYVGADFPSPLWATIRTQFITEKEGIHVFGGVIDSVSRAYSSGAFHVSIESSDNTKYFEMGKVNFKPGVDSFNGAMFDPLTPFKNKFDMISSNYKNDSPELLDENKFLMPEKDDVGGLVKFKAGGTVGKFATQTNLIQDVLVNNKTGRARKAFYAPDGLVYKWKEGIGVFTEFGDALNLYDPTRTGTPNIYANPFAGHDVMNVISLLITGQPYNFVNYWRVVTNLGGITRDAQNNIDSSRTYFESLRNDLVKNNSLWGNFIPFKNLTLDEASKKLLDTQNRITQKSDNLDIILASVVELDARIIATGVSEATNDTIKILQAKRQQLLTDADALKTQIRADNFSYDSLKIVGNDVTFNSDSFLTDDIKNKNLTDPKVRRLLRRKVNELTKRMSWAVRGNNDKNLFIVDDTYDQDYDIIAYNQVLDSDGLKQYSAASEFLSTKDKIKTTAQLLELEAFCDSQGHIRVRPPQYNKMPSSIFYRMTQLKQRVGIQVFPDYLTNILTQQIDGLTAQLEIIEDYIRFLLILLGADYSNPVAGDQSATQFITSGSEGGDGSFIFISDSQGIISNIQEAIKSANVDNIIDAQDTTLKNVVLQSKSNRAFLSSATRFEKVIDLLDPENKAKFTNPTNLNNTPLSTILTRLEIKTGQSVNLDDYTVRINTGGFKVEFPNPNGSNDVLKITKELQSKLGERQRALKSFYNAIKNSIESKSLDNPNSDASNDLLTPVSSSKDVPELFESMIEDESYDDLGPGSGKRYIIKSAQIISYSVREQPPDFTMQQVNGSLDPNLPLNNGTPDQHFYPSAGNGLTSAVAVDYDLWRTYGFKNAAAITVPFLRHPEKQCGPYASMILSRARKNILRSQVTMSGNEYMQPGEVVFLEPMNLLFYVESVSHDFSFGKNFTTSLELSYGHSPGEYIPNPLDIIGKIIYNNRDVGNFTNYRQNNSKNVSNLGIVLRDKDVPGVFAVKKDSFINPYSKQNSDTIKNIIYTAYYILTKNNFKGNSVKGKLEVRIYYDKKNGDNPNEDLKKFRNTVIGLLTGEVETFKDSTSGKIDKVLDKEWIADEESSIIDLSDKTSEKSPSQKAIDAARVQASSSSFKDGGASPPSSTDPNGSSGISGEGDTKNTPSKNKKERDKIRAALFGYIIDCWIVFEQVNTKTNNNG